MNRYSNGKDIVEVSDDLNDVVKAAYLKIIADGGYLPIVEAGEKTENSQFVWYTESIEFDKDNNVYKSIWTPVFLEILISPTKLMTHPAIVQNMEAISELFKNDPKLSSWLLEKCTYIRGSEMAKYACDALNMTEEQMEAIVLDCID